MYSDGTGSFFFLSLYVCPPKGALAYERDGTEPFFLSLYAFPQEGAVFFFESIRLSPGGNHRL